MSTSKFPGLAGLLIVLFLVVLVSGTSYAGDYQLKRQVAPKQVYTAIPDHSDCDRIIFKLREGTSRPQLSDRSFLVSGGMWDRLNQVISAVGKTEALRPRFTLDIAKLDRMRAEGSTRVGWQLPDLTLYYEVQLARDLSAQDRLNMINRLNGLDLVEIAYFAPREEVLSEPETESGQEVLPTPSFEYGQYHLKPAPIGFDAYYAWSFPGGHGENVKVIDIELSWNFNHEDLHGGTDNFHIAGEIDSSRWSSMDHGTAVLGLIAADSNSFGMTGIAYQAELGTISMLSMPIADAVVTALDNSEAGDIILIEVGPSVEINGVTVQLAAEYNQETFDAILTASALGRIVVEIAHNGNQNYDDISLFDSLFYSDYRFSGAIMVASSFPNHVPDPRTNYGQRIDVHGFGCYDVWTLGQGYLWGTDDNNDYTHGFSGTSAASAEISGVCAVIQSIYKEQNLSTLDHAGMRELLTTYSVPQAEHYKSIGPMPDLGGICDAVSGFIRPAPPVLILPEESAYFDAPTQPTFDWNDVMGAVTYDIMIDDNFNFTSPVIEQNGLTISEWTTGELGAGKYFWRVRAGNGNGNGSWSDVRTILVGIQIQAPTLYSPAGGGKINTMINVPLEWYCIEGVIDYVVEIDNYPDFSAPKRTTYAFPCTEGSCLYPVSYLPQGTYYWRVKALGDNWPWSDVRVFNIQGGSHTIHKTVTNEPENKPAAALLANYPNPFNPVTDISFSLFNAGRVKLEIFNILGQKVATLVDGVLSAGDHKVTWDGSNSVSGVYLYRLQTNGFVETRKMILLK